MLNSNTNELSDKFKTRIIDPLEMLSDQNGQFIKQIISDCYFEILEELAIDIDDGDEYSLGIERISLEDAITSHAAPDTSQGFGFIRINSAFIYKLKQSYANLETDQKNILLTYTLTLQLIQSLAHECYHRFQYIADPTSFIDYIDPQLEDRNKYLSQQVEIDARNFAENYLLKIIAKYSNLKNTVLGNIINEYNKTNALGLRLL